MSGSMLCIGPELDNLIRVKAGRGLSLKIYNKEKDKERELLCSIGDSPRSVTWSEQTGSIVRDAAERLNLIQLSTEFYPSTRDQDLATANGIKFDSQTDDGWSNWFRGITANAYLLPDTNILLKRTLSAVIFPSFTDRKHVLSLPFRITIPRLSILELENLANTGQDNKDAKVSKGECFMSFNEVRTLKRNGANLTDILAADVLGLFHSASGKKLIDILIRDEVRRFANSRQTSSMGERSLFVTRDMISALAANCEELSAIYIAPKYPENLSIDNIDLANLRELIIEVATSCGKVEFKWEDGEAFQIEGTWSGKNWYDYFRRRVRVTRILKESPN